ncbi:Zinc finger protein [Cercospora beticola]|uniref:Zinc finger protein n=1 Tax=Cercospora beticola TaxID=122368 RepID=A0A2G5H800_CERBT|nr:Zinc finger protein [Cercospora beticola]PIA88661.1 Zinc finger protein [Cercospora beticola]WPB03016.1 hypothetical protein RHO25_007652 [Cercospora beticola]CAK1358281.1 unnamed protein product [Cercospora beticola]
MPPDIKMPDADLAQAHAESLINSIEAAQKRYACETCGKTYTSPHSRDRHMHLHTGEKRFTCPFEGCGKRFGRRDYLNRHCLVHEKYLGRDPKDLHPGGSFGSREEEIGNFQQEAEGTASSPYADEARYESPGQDNMNAHVNLHEVGNSAHGTSNGRGSSMELKSKTLARGTSPSTALQNSPDGILPSGQDSTAKRQNLDELVSSLRTTKHGTFRVMELDCALCSKSFGRPSDLTRHRSISHGRLAIADKKAVMDKDAHELLNKHKLPPEILKKLGLVCEWENCGQIFSHQADLIRHRKAHGDSRPVKCPFCGKGLSRMDKLKPHVELHHGRKRPRSPDAEFTASASNPAVTKPKRRRSRFVNTFIERPDMPQECHLCGKFFDRPHDLKRHLITKKHNGPGYLPDPSRAKRQSSRPGIYQCPLCPKSFDCTSHVRRHMESSVHNLIVIGPSTASDERSNSATGSGKSGYAQECVGCRQIFVDESSFFDHAPCYRLDVEQQDEPSDAAEAEQEGSEPGEESEDDADQLDDFEAQLVAAANGQLFEDAVEKGTETAPRNPQLTSTAHKTSAAHQTTEDRGDRERSQDHQYGRLHDKDFGATRHRFGEPSVQTSTASDRRTASLPPPAEHRPVPASALTPLRGATRMLIGARESGKSQPSPPPPYHAPSNSQNVRRCYGCGAGFPSKEAFWNHSPCFTTAVQPVVSSQDERGAASNETLQRSATPDKHDSGQEMMATEPKPPARPSDDSASSEPFVEAMPSLKVQQLLISIALNNPGARPIPPSELASLTDKSPNLLELVTRMERENAEMQRILKQKWVVPSSLHQESTSSGTTLVDGDGLVERSMVSSKTPLANPTRATEHLDRMKATDPDGERLRLQQVFRLRGYRHIQPSPQGHDGRGDFQPGADGSGGMLGRNPAVVKEAPERRLQNTSSSHASMQRSTNGPAAGEPLRGLHVRQRNVSQKASLGTASGLRLVDATNSDHEQMFEDDTP